MNLYAHLVLVSGVAVPQAKGDRDPKEFFACQFPESLIDEFSFFDNTTNSDRLLNQRSNVLLEQLLKSRGSSKLPIVFLAHGLGGLVVKQAIISATEELRYREIALCTSTILFFGVPHRESRQSSWEHLYLRLLSESASFLVHPLKHVHCLIEELQAISTSFWTISGSFEVSNFYETSKSPVLDQTCSLLGRQDETNIPLDCPHEGLWDFTNKAVAQKVCKRIRETTNGRDFSLRDCLRQLSVLDSQTHQLKPLGSEPPHLDSVISRKEYQMWKSDHLRPILCISGPPGSGTTSTTARILGTLLDQDDRQNLLCLSFSFDKNNVRACTPLSLYISLCRQLLSFRPQLFHHISSAFNFIAKNGVFTAENFWIIIRCLVTNLLDDHNASVFCIINAVDKSHGTLTEMTKQMEEFVQLSNGRFKLLLSGTKVPRFTSLAGASQREGIDLEIGSNNMMSSKRQFVQDMICELALENSAWNGLESIAVGQLEKLPADSPYLLIKLNMFFLGWASSHSTRKELRERLQQLPASVHDCYALVMATIDKSNRNWVTTALRWIVHAVRPLRPSELAVAVALNSIPRGHPWKKEALDELDDLIREDIVGDLNHFMAPLVKVENNRVYLIHDTYRDFLLNTFAQSAPRTGDSSHTSKYNGARHESWQGESTQDEAMSEDGHYEILLHCLEYLKSFGKQGLDYIKGQDGARCSRPIDEGFSLLSYASLYWPRHFLETASELAAHNYVLEFLRNDRGVEDWISLYYHLNPTPKSNDIGLDSPLKIVCNFGLIQLVGDCLNMAKSSANHEGQMRESLDLASRNGHHNVVQTLLREDVRSSDALGLAAAGGFGDVVESLLGFDPAINKPDRTGYTPLHHATSSGNVHIVSLLLAKHADVNASASPPPGFGSLESISGSRDETAQNIDNDTEPGPDSDSEIGESALSSLESGRSTLSRTVLSETSLHLAALTGQIEIAKALVAEGANVNAENSVGYDTLKYAAAGGFPEMLTLLLQHGDGTKVSESDGNTALHLAAAHGHCKAAEVLLKDSRGGSKLIDTTNNHGLSPVHIAAREGHLSLLKLMIGYKDAESTGMDEDLKAPSSKPRRSRRVRPGSTITRSFSMKQIEDSEINPDPFTMSEDHRRSALEWAAVNGHYQVVNELLTRDVESKPEHRAFALNLATKYGHTDVMALLLDNFTQAAIEFRQYTAIHIAAKRGHSETLKILLEHRRDTVLFRVDATEEKGMTPIHLAAQAGHADIIRILLEHNARIDLDDTEEKKPLHYAAEHGHLRCVELLLECEHIHENLHAATTQKKTALHLAAQNGHMSVVRQLCATKNMIWMKDANDSTAFDLVVGRGKVEEVSDFIHILKDLTDDGEEFTRGGAPLHFTSESQNMEVLRILLENGWRCDTRDANEATPLHRAVKGDFLPGVDVLLQNPSCDINAHDSSGCTVMHYVRTPGMAKALLNAGADIDPKDNFGQTPLFLAIWYGHLQVVEEMLNFTPKPNVHTQDDDGWNLLHAGYDNEAITELMLKHKVNPNATNCDGRTPLAVAMRWNYPDVAELLLAAEADPDLADNVENSPLFMAIKQENPLKMVELLVSKGVNLLAMDSDGNTALHVAARGNMHAKVEYLVTRLEDAGPTGFDKVLASVLCQYMSNPEFDSPLAEILIRKFDANLNADVYSRALHEACFEGTFYAVKWLLDKEADVNKSVGKHGSTLCDAVESWIDSEKKVSLLLEKQANVNFVEKNRPSALQRATSKANEKLINLLLDHGANVNLIGGDLDAPLNSAILGRVELTTIETMLRNGADTAQIGIGGKLPIHFAAASDQVDVLDALITEKADVFAKDAGHRSALMHALVNRSDEVASYLLSNGHFKVNEKDATDQTPLIAATLFNSKAAVDMLLENGFNKPEVLNAKDYEGKTALVYAASAYYPDVVRKLVDSGADPGIIDCRGRTALYWAARTGRIETLNIIIEAFAKYEYDSIKYWDAAIHGAVAANKVQVLEKLLERDDVDPENTSSDGWTPLYTAQRHGFDRIINVLRKELDVSRSDIPGLKIPSGWHSIDRCHALVFNPNTITIIGTCGGNKLENLVPYEPNNGAARADYPMIPLFNGEVYYFEIKVIKAASQGYLGIGFCDDKFALQRMLGWDPGSWGFHSDNGQIYEDGTGFGIPYSEPFSEGAVIGCGVNFSKETAFYTREGKVIGRAFTNIRGKLYPAISMDITQEGWEISAVFPDEDGKSTEFLFRGDYDSNETLEPVRVDSDDATSGSDSRGGSRSS